MLIVLLVYPPARQLLFPPAPLALVNGKTGGIQKPKAGVLGSTDSATGAPENLKGEAVEAEASNFVNGIASVALASASGKHPQGELQQGERNTPDSRVPDPTSITSSIGAARAKSSPAAHSAVGTQDDKAKVPMETAMWNKMRPFMHGIGDVCDTWERFANALEPTKPFPRDVVRLRLAALVVPLLAVSLITTSYMFTKCASFGLGAAFFGDPLISPSLKWLNSAFPHWQKLLEIRNTILKGVPTNAQLTITLLRIGEVNNAPLPPPPSSNDPPPEEAVEITDKHLRAVGSDYPLNATDEELRTAIENNDPSVPQATSGEDIDKAKSPSGKRSSKIVSFFKNTVKGTVESALGADHLKAKTGSIAAKNRLGIVPKNREELLSGPVDFACRYHGKRGHVLVSTRATVPCVSFSLVRESKAAASTGKDDETVHPVWSVAVADIRELKKIGGLGWKAKLVVAWAMNREVADGLEIMTKTGETYKVTAMVLRDELFNRLVAMGGQRWESL